MQLSLTPPLVVRTFGAKLLEEQEKKKEENKRDTEKKEEEKSDELSAEEISEKFNPQKGGNPENPAQVLSCMVQKGLADLASLPYLSFSDVGIDHLKNKAKAAMNKYLEDIGNDVKTRKNKSSEAKKKFLDILSKEEEKKQFVEALAQAAMKAYQKISGKPDIDGLTNKFVEELESSATEICPDENNCESIDLSEALKKQK